jgi:hypothetical protein
MEQHSAPLPVARSASTPSLTTSPATGASAGSRSRAGRSHHRVGGLSPAAPLTFSGDRLAGVQISAAQKRPSRWASHGSGPTAGPLGRGEPLDVRSSSQSYRALPLTASTMTTLQCRGVAMTRMTPTCCSSRPPRWQHRHSTTTQATGPHRRRHPDPPPSASWYGYRCDHAWRSGVSCVAPCVQRASSTSWPGSG